MKIKHTTQDLRKFRGDMITFFVYQQNRKIPSCNNEYVQNTIKLAFKAGDFSGKEGETLLFYPAEKEKLPAKRVLVVGLGKAEEGKSTTGKNPADAWRENYRMAGGRVSETALKTRTGKILVVVPDPFILKRQETTECLTEGLMLGAYQFKKYKKNKQEDEPPGAIKEIMLFTEKAEKPVLAGLKMGRIAAFAGCAARDMANEPGNVWTPARFAEFGRKLAKTYDLT
jgi:leucyl aminopeptidase